MVKPLKILAIVSSMVLVGGYLAYRSGAGEKILPSSKSFQARPVDAERQEASTAADPAATAPATAPVDFKVFAGSKSAAHVIEPSDVSSPTITLTTQPASTRSTTQP